MLMKFFSWIGNLISGNVLDRVFNVIEKNVDNAKDKEILKAQALNNWVDNHTQLQISRTWWFQLFFVIPLGVWFSSVVLYSMLWCQDCVYPQTWSIAALPPPLDQWAAWIIMSLFGVAMVDKYLGKK
jgi:hypothetical protein